MPRHLALALVLFAACSSDPTTPGVSAPVDSGGNPFADATPQDVVYGEVSFPPPTEEARCKASAPRLEWRPEAGPAACFDTALSAAMKYDVACVFMKHADGKLRCLPYFGGKRAGWNDATCAHSAWSTCWGYPFTTAVVKNRQVIVRTDDEDGVHVRYAYTAPTVGVNAKTYAIDSSGQCAAQVDAPACDIFNNYGVQVSYAVADELDASKFFAPPY